MVEKVYTANIIENDAFRKYAHLFLERPMTALEVEKQSNVTRQTIIKQLKQLGQYILQPKWSPTIKGKPLQIDIKLIADYLATKLNLENDECDYLNKILHDPAINTIIIKDNDTIDDAISKTLLTVLLIGVIRYRFANDEHTSLSFVDSLFGEFLRSKIFAKKPREKKHKKLDANEVQELNIKVMYSSLTQNEVDFKAYETTIKGYAKSGSDEFDTFDALLNKLRRSELPIITYPNIWYEIFGFTIEPSLHYTEYLGKKYRRNGRMT